MITRMVDLYAKVIRFDSQGDVPIEIGDVLERGHPLTNENLGIGSDIGYKCQFIRYLPCENRFADIIPVAHGQRGVEIGVKTVLRLTESSYTWRH